MDNLDLRLQLLEPDRYPYLYKCLYGLLMLLPQSSAFGALKNRLNSVSAIGLLHTPASMPTSARPSTVAGMSGTSLPSATGTGAVPGRLNRTARDVNASNSDVKWPELMDKFKQTQEKARRRNERLLRGGGDADGGGTYAGSGTRTRVFSTAPSVVMVVVVAVAASLARATAPETLEGDLLEEVAVEAAEEEVVEEAGGTARSADLSSLLGAAGGAAGAGSSGKGGFNNFSGSGAGGVGRRR